MTMNEFIQAYRQHMLTITPSGTPRAADFGYSLEELTRKGLEDFTVHIPGEITDPTTISALSKLNRLFVSMKHDFIGTVRPRQIKSLQCQFYPCPAECALEHYIMKTGESPILYLFSGSQNPPL